MSVLPRWLKRAFISLTAATAIIGGVASANTISGPSSSQSPYIVRAMPGVITKSVLTVGDTPAGSSYRMVGIPDGLGAFDNRDGTFTLLMNHELGGTVGITRAHGAQGAFISRWIIRKGSLEVVSGEDLIKTVMVWNSATQAYEPATTPVVFSRFCSADLAPISAYYADDGKDRERGDDGKDRERGDDGKDRERGDDGKDRERGDDDKGLGYRGRIFMNGEESGVEGRAFAHLMDGTSYELPRLGKFSWENSIANPETGRYTVVAGTDDGQGGQVYFYVGTKTNSDNPVEAAGLTNGNLYSIKVDGLLAETNATVLSGPVAFSGYNFGDVSAWTGAQLEAASQGNVTSFQRPEDGAWDPNNPNDFYFVTTASFTGNSRLWRVRFNDAANPTAGGTIEMLLDGSEGQKMMDNIAINDRGQIVIQEDPGNQAHIAKIWRYDIRRDTLTLVAQHDPERFTPGAANFLTQDEESSGVIDMSGIMGEGWYLLVQQAHYNIGDAELVEGGQLLAMRIPSGKK